MNPEQVREEARKLLLEMLNAGPGDRKPRLSYPVLAARLGTTAYFLKKAMLLEEQPVPAAATARWGRGRPRKDYGVTEDEVRWAVKEKTLRQQVGCSLKARTLAFNQRFGRAIGPNSLRGWYKRFKIQHQKFYVREGRPFLLPAAEQAAQLEAVQARVIALASDNYYVVQLDEACFSSKKNDRRHWAPAGKPIEIREKYVALPQIKVCAGICRSTGLVATMFSEKAFTGADLVTMLGLIRSFYGPDSKVAVFMDNASYHRTQEVRDEAARLRIELVMNSPYRPDLNGIELMWRRAKVAYYNLIDSWRALGRREWDQMDIVRKCVEEIPREAIKKIADGGWDRLSMAEPINAELRPWESGTLAGLVQQQNWWTHRPPATSLEEVRREWEEAHPPPQ